MPEPLLLVAFLVPVLVAVWAAMKGIARLEHRAQARQWMDRVYFPKRGRKAGVPELKRRSEPERRQTGG